MLPCVPHQSTCMMRSVDQIYGTGSPICLGWPLPPSFVQSARSPPPKSGLSEVSLWASEVWAWAEKVLFEGLKAELREKGAEIRSWTAGWRTRENRWLAQGEGAGVRIVIQLESVRLGDARVVTGVVSRGKQRLQTGPKCTTEEDLFGSWFESVVEGFWMILWALYWSGSVGYCVRYQNGFPNEVIVPYCFVSWLARLVVSCLSWLDLPYLALFRRKC